MIHESLRRIWHIWSPFMDSSMERSRMLVTTLLNYSVGVWYQLSSGSGLGLGSSLHEATSWTWSLVLRKTGALLLQTSKSWMRMWSMRRENRNLTSRMRTRANPSRQVGFGRFSWSSSASVSCVFHVLLMQALMLRRMKRSTSPLLTP